MKTFMSFLACAFQVRVARIEIWGCASVRVLNALNRWRSGPGSYGVAFRRGEAPQHGWRVAGGGITCPDFCFP